MSFICVFNSKNIQMLMFLKVSEPEWILLNKYQVSKILVSWIWEFNSHVFASSGNLNCYKEHRIKHFCQNTFGAWYGAPGFFVFVSTKGAQHSLHLLSSSLLSPQSSAPSHTQRLEMQRWFPHSNWEAEQNLSTKGPERILKKQNTSTKIK